MTASSLSGRKVLLIVGGGIAAYKALELIRLLKKAEAEVMAVLTKAGAEFVTPMSLAALTGHPVRQALFMPEDETAMGHIELSRWADLVVVAPATAGLIAKAANGMADDLASTTLLATDKKVLLAPAMNVRMWLHPAVQANVERLSNGSQFYITLMRARHLDGLYTVFAQVTRGMETVEKLRRGDRILRITVAPRSGSQ